MIERHEDVDRRLAQVGNLLCVGDRRQTLDREFELSHRSIVHLFDCGLRQRAARTSPAVTRARRGVRRVRRVVGPGPMIAV